MQVLNTFGRMQAITQKLIGMPKNNFAVFRRRTGGQFRAGSQFFCSAEDFFIMFGNNDDIRLCRQPCLPRQRLKPLPAIRRINAARQSN